MAAAISTIPRMVTTAIAPMSWALIRVRSPRSAGAARLPGRAAGGVRQRVRPVIEDRQPLDRQREGRHAERHDGERHDDFHPRRQVTHPGRRLHAGDADVHAVHDEAEHRQEAGRHQPAFAGAHAGGDQDRHRQDHPDHELQQEHPGLVAQRQDQRQAAGRGDPLQPQQAVDAEHDHHGPGQRLQEIDLEVAAEGPAAEVRLDDHHADAAADRRHEEQERQQRRVPQRVQLVRDDEVERSERRLVQRRQQDAGDHQRRAHRQDDAAQPLEPQPLEDHRGELDRQHGGVKHDAPGDLEHDRPRVPEDQGVPDAPRLSEVEHQPDDHQDVAEEAGQDRRPDDRLEALEVEDVHRGGQREGAGRQPDPAQHVEADPQPPGELVAEVGGGPEPAGEADRRHPQEDGPEDDEHRLPEAETGQREFHGRLRRGNRIMRASPPRPPPRVAW
jgi:hypothetical protein